MIQTNIIAKTNSKSIFKLATSSVGPSFFPPVGRPRSLHQQRQCLFQLPPQLQPTTLAAGADQRIDLVHLPQRDVESADGIEAQ